MKVVFTGSEAREWSIHSAVEISLEGDGSGQVERAQDQANNNSKAIAMIVEILANKGLMTPAELGDFLNYRFKVEE